MTYIGHAAALKDELTAEENLASLASLHARSADRDAIGTGARLWSLERQRALPARALSQGQRRRIGLARLALVPRPLWILDEPTAALDAAGVALLCDLLGAHLAQGGIAIIATHQDIALVRTVGARLVVVMTAAQAASRPLPRPARGAESHGRCGATSGSRCARRPSSACSCLFYVIVVTLFPLGVGPDSVLLRALGPGVLWVAALLASLLALPRLFAMDFADGTLEQMALSPYPLPALISGKIAAHWLATGLPLVAASPLLGLQFGLGGDELVVLALGLLLGTPTLSLLGAIGAALTLGLRSGALLALLVLPLYVPVLIFGAGAVDAVRTGLGASAQLSLLGAGLLAALVGAPLAAAAAVRIALD